MNTPKLFSAVMVFILAGSVAQAMNKTWTGAASTTDWSTDGNWNPVGVPGVNDAVFISSGSVVVADSVAVASVTLSGGTCTFNGAASLGTLALSGNATLGGTNVVTVTNLTWTGGYMTGVGQTVVAPGGSLWIDGTGAKYLSQRVLSNQGAAVWTNTGYFYGYYGAVVNNSGTWDTRGDTTFYYYGGGSYPPTPVFNNSGSFTKTGGAGSTVFSGTAFNNSGSVSVQKGTLSFQNSRFTQTAGSTRLNGGLLASAPYAIDINGGVLCGNGTVTADVDNAGELNPGASIGALTIAGALIHPGSLNIEIGGLISGSQFDRLNVTGLADLHGLLNLRLSPGYRPNIGDTFQILSFGSRSGAFNRIYGLDLGGGLYLKPIFNPTSLVLVATNGTTNLLALMIGSWEVGQFQLRFIGPPEEPCCIQASTDLITWTSLCTNVTPSGVIEFLDVSASNYPQRFYRAVTGP